MKDLRMVLFLLVVTTVCTLLLAGAQLAYVKASHVFNLRLYGTILEMMGMPAEEDRVETVFTENFETIQHGARTYYRSRSVEPGTLVLTAEGAGLWSRIEILLAVAPDGQTLRGMRVLSQAETPGLGGRIAERQFQDRFAGVRARPTIELVKVAMADNQVDAVSGATRTSSALETIINKGLDKMVEAFGEGQPDA